MLRALEGDLDQKPDAEPEDKLACLTALERKVLWLSTWMIHNANHLRPNRDGLKVGGHQASSASVATLMTALYFDVLRPQDRVAVKPHASPVFHAIQYLLGHQTREKLERFRAYGGAQSYPSRTKDGDIVDFSTGSVGLGVGMTLFSSIAQDYLRLKELVPTDKPPGRMIALAGDAELDEGNIFEALLEGWKHDVRNLWWVIDYNRQSLDAVVSDRLFGRIDAMFEMMGWRVVTLKYGRLLEAAFARPDGHQLREWIDACPNSLYSALVYKGGEGWREHLQRDLNRYPGIRAILDDHDDAELQRLMTNLGGHDLASVLDAFHAIVDDRPTCFIAYTIKGYGLPFAGHKDNHAGLMNLDQMASFQRSMMVEEGAEWDLFAGLDLPAARLSAFLEGLPLAASDRRWHDAAPVPVPANLPVPRGDRQSTQEAFGRLLGDIAASDTELARRIVTTSPDVTVSTNLGPWVNRRGIFDRAERADTFREEKVVSAQRWAMSPQGQHIELGIAESNLFLQLAAFPQPQDEAALGLRIWNEAPIRSSTKSISAPLSRPSDTSSTTTATPSRSNTTSSSLRWSSKVKPYWNPEQPPPETAILRNAFSACSSTFSEAMRRTALSVRAIWRTSFSSMLSAMCATLPTCRLAPGISQPYVSTRASLVKYAVDPAFGRRRRFSAGDRLG